MYLEVIYENGEHSVMQADDEAEALTGIAEQHRRAMNGERGLQGDPASPPAVRIKRVFVYDEHPGSLGESQLVDTKDIKAAVEALAEGNLVSVPEMVQTLRNLTNPRINTPPHESNFLMESKKEIKENRWNGEVAA